MTTLIIGLLIPLLGHYARLSLRVFHEGRDVREITENIAGFRIGCD